MKRLSFCFLALMPFLIPQHINCQTLVTIGSGTETNGPTNFPAPYGNNFRSSKHQMIIMADELTDEGISEGDFTSIAFDVTDGAGILLGDFRISLKMITGNLTDNFETGMTLVYGPYDYEPIDDSWNTHTFDFPFTWDGTSNLIVETCFFSDDNDQNALTRLSSTGFNSTTISVGFNNSACNNNSGFGFPVRSNMQLAWNTPEIPPIADFELSSISECSGVAFFEDLSQFEPDTWIWDFGDGGMSGDENPQHTYMNSGTYDVTLIVSNAFGADTIVYDDLVTVTIVDELPLEASCFPVTQDGSLGFGITQVILEDMDVSSGDASEGYLDNTCNIANLELGGTYNLEVEIVGPSNSHVVAWIDYNSDGQFLSDEKILSLVSNSNVSADFTVPGSALTDTTLRMRVISDFYLLGEPTPCGDPASGQGEDYSILIAPNLSPPTANFIPGDTLSCSGVVQFYDLSEDVPTAWFWQFGDSEFSNDQNPIHTYTSSGFYDVTLTVQNDNGMDEIVISNAVHVDLDLALVPAACSPITSDYCCDFGIYNFSFAQINHDTENGVEGYQDYSCEQVVSVTEGLSYSISVNTGNENAHDVVAWIDTNNDGSFTSDEIIFESLNSFNHNGNISFPYTDDNGNKLRLRVAADFVGSSLNGCNNLLFGQVEDYAVIVEQTPDLPVANYFATPVFTCDGEVQFTDLSEIEVTEWFWDFGDTETSIEQNPLHIYTTSGIYDVSLTTTNVNGDDILMFTNYITVDLDGICDTINIPVNGIGPTQTTCQGFLADDGGDGNYSPDTDASITIAPSIGDFVQLTFSEFAFQFNSDFLEIYDGPDTSSPLIGAFTGGGLPNGGIVTSTGPAITLRQISNGFIELNGFLCQWECMLIGIEEYGSENISLYPNPSSSLINIYSRTGNSLERISVFNTLGEALTLNWVTKNFNHAILDVNGFDQGLYFLTVENENGKVTKKFVKE